MRSPRRHSRSDEVEYDSLPPALRRKYFSSLERLRLAQDGQSLPTTSSRSSNHIKSASHPLDALSLWSARRLQLQSGLSLTGNRLRKSRASTPQNQVTPAWFTSLPPAAQRKLFSDAECARFTQSSPPIILDAADELLRRRSWHPQYSPPSPLFTPEPRRVSDSEAVIDIDEYKDERVDSAIDMADYTIDGLRWLDDEDELDLKLDDYHKVIADTARRQAEMDLTRPHRRRNTSMSSISFRRGRSSISSSKLPLDSPISPVIPIMPTAAAAATHSRTTSRTPSVALTHIRSQGSISSIDPRAAHYQDPAARLKLRLYLASPQKFDEAIEFGFPSLQHTPPFAMDRPKTSPAPRSAEIGRTFFYDDTPELSGDEGEDSDEPDAACDPRTPDDALFHMHRPSLPKIPKVPKTSFDSMPAMKPKYGRRMTESYGRGSAADREMTLHMTLTRPDLRSPDEQNPNHPAKINAVPLERSDLVAESAPMPSVWDTLPPEESKMKRFLRKLKFK